MRLNRYLALAGWSSRRAAERIIQDGRVTVNDRPGRLHSRVDPERDTVRVDGRIARTPGGYTYLVLNKPPGFDVTRADRHAPHPVYELLPRRYRHLAYVGRLDRASEGLLIFTDDGELSYRLQRPEYRVPREYQVRTPTTVSRSMLERIRRGVQIGPGERARVVRASFRAAPDGGGWLHLTLTEGKKREVRRLCKAVGIRVERLRRVRFGPLRLGPLAPGKVRRLTAEEIRALQRAAQK